MSKIQVMVLPFSDEYLYGYLRRLAFCNNMNFDTLCRTALRSSRIKSVSTDACHHYDCVQPLYSLFNQIDRIHTPEHPYVDPVEVFMNTSIYSCIAPLMSESQQNDWILRIFDRNAEETTLITYHHKDTMDHLRLCPECLKEDIETCGFPLIHRSHQYPRQTICVKHEIKLLEYTGQKGREFFAEEYLNDFSPVKLHHTFLSELEYSRFVSEFAKLGLQCDLRDITAAIRARCAELQVDCDEPSTIKNLPYLKRASWLNKELLPKLRQFLKKFGAHQRTIGFSVTLQILYILFESAEDIQNYLPDNREDEENLLELISKEGYRLVSEYNRTIVQMEHSRCGTRFVTTPAAFKNGFRCPYCQEDMNDAERFRYMFAVQTMGEYKLLSDYKSMNTSVTVKHMTCGRTYDVSPEAFIKKGVRCSCFYGADNKKTALQRMKKYPDFRLVSFTSMNEPARIRCLKCGTIITFRDVYRFLDRPSCRVCEPYFYDGNRLEKTMKDLVGDEYSINPKEFVSMHTPMTITHNVCGNKEAYAPIEFTRGRRCRYCNTTLTSDQVSTLLAIQTGGRYTFEGFNTEAGSRYIVKDNETGKTMSLLKAQIIQELRRPTPSDIFENHTPVGFSDQGRLEEWISRKPDMSWFTLESAALELKVTEEELEMELAELCMKRVILEIQHGHRIYQVIGREADPESIVKEVLLKDSAGNPIGYFTGSSFLRSLGVEGKSDSIGFISNLYRGKTKVHFLLNGIRCNATGPKYGDVTNENYAILQIISWVIGSAFTMRNKEVVKAVLGYMREKGLDESDIEPYSEMVHPRTVERYLRLVEMIEE